LNEASENDSARPFSDCGTEKSNEPDNRKISVERTQRKSLKANSLATENEENDISNTRVSGNVEGKSIIIIHDVIDTGRLIKTAVEVSNVHE
jgi:pyrimidine operon attenuation protein/uracil phosphoribosyltransferase